MKYLSIDIETTGLDPLKDQLLSFGAIIEDTENPLPFDEIPKFHAAIKRNRIEGDLFAINMNKELIENKLKIYKLIQSLKVTPPHNRTRVNIDVDPQ